MRLDFTNGAQPRLYALDARRGGRACKTVQFMVKVIASGGTTPKLGMDVVHGPDGTVFESLQSFSTATVPASGLYVFSVDTTKIVGDCVQAVLKMDGGAGDAWMVVEVFELRKPF